MIFIVLVPCFKESIKRRTVEEADEIAKSKYEFFFSF